MTAMRLAVLAASLAAACAAPGQKPQGVSAERPATAPEPEPKARRDGRLVLRHHVAGVMVCARDGCSVVPGVPPKVASVTQNGKGRYLVATDASTFEWDLARNSVEELPAGSRDVFARLDDGSLIRFEHLPKFSRAFRKTASSPWTPIGASPASKPQEFRFLSDGRYLFKDSPGMGASESLYFVNLIPNVPTHLYVVDGPAAKPRKVHSSPQQLDADFFDGGRRVAWWRPGRVDPAKNERTIALETIAVATSALGSFAVVTTPVHTANGGVRRDAPGLSSSLGSTWLVHESSFDVAWHPTSLRAQEVSKGDAVEHPLGPDESLAPAIPHGDIFARRHGRRWSEHVVIVKHDEQSPVGEYRVVAIPSFETVYRVTGPTFGVTAADWVDSE